MPSIYIEDRLGLKSGIEVSKVWSSLNKKSDSISIIGLMSSKDHIVCSLLEPDLQCNIKNNDGEICFSEVSKHEGIYSESKKVTFTLKIESVSRKIGWDNIAEIELFVIFRNRS